MSVTLYQPSRLPIRELIEATCHQAERVTSALLSLFSSFMATLRRISLPEERPSSLKKRVTWSEESLVSFFSPRIPLKASHRLQLTGELDVRLERQFSALPRFTPTDHGEWLEVLYSPLPKHSKGWVSREIDEVQEVSQMRGRYAAALKSVWDALSDKALSSEYLILKNKTKVLYSSPRCPLSLELERRLSLYREELSSRGIDPEELERAGSLRQLQGKSQNERSPSNDEVLF